MWTLKVWTFRTEPRIPTRLIPEVVLAPITLNIRGITAVITVLGTFSHKVTRRPTTKASFWSANICTWGKRWAYFFDTLKP